MDSASQIVHCMQLGAAEAGMPVCTAEEIRHIIGLALPEALAQLYPGHTTLDHLRVKERYAHHFVAGTGGHAELFAGVRELVEELAGRHRIAIATGKSRIGLDRVLERINWSDLFHATRTADETASKPHPQMLLELLEELGIEPEEALMIGDTSYDMEMAVRAGVPGVAVTWGVHDAVLLQQHAPIRMFHDTNELAAWLRSF